MIATDAVHQKVTAIVKEVEIERSKTAWAKWSSFCRKTTCHGMARIIDKDEPLLLRILFGLTIKCLAIGLLKSIYIISYEKLVIKGLSREFILQHNDTMTLPDVHICDTSLFNRTVLQGVHEESFFERFYDV